jgi:hypothetical protein
MKNNFCAFCAFCGLLRHGLVSVYESVQPFDSLQDLRNQQSKAIIPSDYSRIPKSFGLPSARD